MNISKGVIKTAKKILIYGPEGIGKSTFASKFPNPIFCDTEGGTKMLDVNRFDMPTSQAMVLEQIQYIKNHPDVCSTFVIDTADWLEKLCIKNVCSVYKKSGIEEFGYGKGYVYVNEKFGEILNKLDELIAMGINVVFLAHAVMRKFEQPDELGSYDRWELKLDKRNAAMIKEWVDAVLFVNYKTIVEKVDKTNKYKASGGKRVMYTQHHSCWDAKNRFGLPEEVEFSYSVIAPYIQDSGSHPETVRAETEKPPQTSEKEAPKKVPADISGLPRELTDLMSANNVTEEEIRLAVSQRGYFPFETKIENYGEDFINGCLIGAWNSVFEIILANRDLPFE